MRSARILAALACLLALGACKRSEPEGITHTTATKQPLPAEQPFGALEVAATFSGPMPTGVTVSRAGRIFVNFPRWGDPVDATVAEVVHGQAVPFPNAEINRWPGGAPADQLVSVQSVIVDPLDRLWILDPASPKMEGVVPGGAKLVSVNLGTGHIDKKIVFPPDVALPTTYLNDVRFDLRRGNAGMAFITDSAVKGPNGIIVVDLESGRSWRRLHDHPSTKAEKTFLPFVEGRELWQRKPGQPRERMGVGSDGIAISNDGKKLFYCPLASRKLYAVSIDALANEKLSDADVAKTVEDLGEKGASDGLESDAEGRIYVTNYEANAILRRNTDGSFATLVHDDRALWPDTLSLASDGWLYFTANQLHRQPQYHDGKDERVKPYTLFRVKTDGTPIRLVK